MRWLAVLLVLPLASVPALGKSKKPAAKTTQTKKAPAKPKSAPGVTKPDMEARALVRKKAPFIIEERFRGDTIRLNKDGTFSREGELKAYTSQGSWKVTKGKLTLKWNSGEQYGYKITFNGKTPVVAGQKANKSNRYVLHSAE